MPNHTIPISSFRLYICMMVLGLSEGITQVVLLREVISFAGGNELSLGLALMSWLMWTALGSFSSAAIFKKRTLSSPAPALLLSGLAGLMSLVCSMLLPAWLGNIPGASPSLVMALLYGLICLAPAGVMGGAHYPMLLSLLPAQKATGLARLYGLESLGGALAGILFGLLLVWLAPPFTIMLLAALFCGLVSLWAAGTWRSAALLWTCALMLLLVWSGGLGAWLKERQWQGRGLTAWTDSPYAQLSLTKQAEQSSFYASGSWLFSQPDRLGLERRALVPLLAAPRAETALFIGGGASGEAAKALKRGRLKRVVALELDPWLVRLAGKNAPPPGLEMAFGDGRVYLARTREKFDLVVISAPPPSTLQLNRYYSRQGMSALARVLRPQGAAVLRLPGVEHLMGPLQARRLQSILQGAKPIFPGLVLYSGEELFICLYKSPRPEPDAAQVWLDRLSQKDWPDVVGVRPDTVLSALDGMRRDFMLQQMEQVPKGPANGDYLPRALLFDSDLWGIKLGGLSGLARWLAGLDRLTFMGLLVAALLLAFIWAVFMGARRKPGAALMAGVMVAGFSGMAGSLLLLMIYQVVSGAVYLGLTLVLAAFMAGMSLSALTGGRARVGPGNLALINLGLALICLALGAAARWLPTGAAVWPLYVLSLSLGALAGIYFAWAGIMRAAQLKAPGAPPPRSLAGLGGGLYGLDLVGGMLGALLPALLLPTVGIYAALAIPLGLNLLIAFWLWALSRK